MKLSKLKHLAESEQPIPDEDVDKYRLYEGALKDFQKVIKDIKRDYLFWKELIIPEGYIHFTIQAESFHMGPDTFQHGNFGEIYIRIDFYPNEDRMIIPNNVLAIGIEDFVEEIKKKNPDLYNKPSLYPVDFFKEVIFQVKQFYIFTFNGVYDMSEFMDTPTFNLKVRGVKSFYDIFFSRSKLLDDYTLVDGDLPTFSDDFVSECHKIVNKGVTVVKALRKGKWKGHEYEIPLKRYESDNIRKNFVLHQDRSSYNKVDKVIRPDVRVMTNFGYEIVDGQKNSPSESPLSPEEQKEFTKYLKSRFAHFGIDY